MSHPRHRYVLTLLVVALAIPAGGSAQRLRPIGLTRSSAAPAGAHYVDSSPRAQRAMAGAVYGAITGVVAAVLVEHYLPPPDGNRWRYPVQCGVSFALLGALYNVYVAPP